MLKTVLFCLLVAAPLAAVPAAAAPNNGQIDARVAAEVRSAEALTRVSPNDGGAYIELAQAYARADRPVDAAAAYRRALVLDNEMMQTKSGDEVWSRNVARTALANYPQMTSR